MSKALITLQYNLNIAEQHPSLLLATLLDDLKKKLIEINTDREAIGVYLSTSTAGQHEAIKFWKEALDKTPAFVNPAIFPWTLPNAPASHIAQVLSVTGPVYTFLSFAESIEKYLSAGIDFSKKRIQFALIGSYEYNGTQLQLELTLVNKKQCAEILSKQRTEMQP